MSSPSSRPQSYTDHYRSFLPLGLRLVHQFRFLLQQDLLPHPTSRGKQQQKPHVRVQGEVPGRWPPTEWPIQTLWFRL